jgi:hypothetical protein
LITFDTHYPELRFVKGDENSTPKKKAANAAFFSCYMSTRFELYPLA